MVTGIDSFKKRFKGSEEQYAIIGGTVCDILMTEGIYTDVQEFVQRMQNESVDIKQLGLVGRTKDQILDELKDLYIAQ